MVFWQPLANVRWHQKRLLAITRDEPLRHPGIVLNRPDSTPTYATAPDELVLVQGDGLAA